LGWDDLAPLHALLTGVDDSLRAAAAEAAARLPLSESAWERVGRVLMELLVARPTVAVARATAHAPLVGLRHQLRAVAADGGHPGQHVASVALSEVGDDSVLAADVSHLLARPLTARTAVRLAGLPLERLPFSPDRIPDLPASTEGLQSLCVAVAAARLGDPDRLGRFLHRAGDDPAVLLLTEGSADDRTDLVARSRFLLSALRAVPPLPGDVLAYLDRQLSPEADALAHRVLRSMWLTPARPPGPPHRLDDFNRPLANFVEKVNSGAVALAGAVLAWEAMRLDGGAPDPQQVYTAWTRVAESAAAAWPDVAWILGRAGARVLVGRLSPWLSDPDVALSACRAVADAAGWLATPPPMEDPAVVIPNLTMTRTASPLDETRLPAPEQPPWPRPTELVDPTLAVEAPPTDPWAEEVPSFDAGFEAEGIEVPAAPPPTPAAPPPAPPSRGGAVPPGQGTGPELDTGEFPAVVEIPRPRAAAYAKLSCPSAVVVHEEFDLELGLGPRPTRGVTAQPLTLPDRPAYTLTVQVIVDGFTLREGEQPTFDLDVTTQTPYPTRTLHLAPVSDPDLGPIRSILAVFSVDGRTVGSATRAVEVVPTRSQLPRAAVDAPPTGVDTALPSDAQTADLTITISKGDDLDGRRLLWSFQSPHPTVPGSAEPLGSALGSRPEDFAKSLMRTAGRVQGASLTAEIIGAGRLIARLVPTEVHEALRATAAAVGASPSVLLLSADPYVPWELARIDQPWLPGAPPMLGAQAAVGRWALREPGPTSEPPRSVSVRDMTIVRGVYERVIGFNRLIHAEQEALDLQAAYGATLVDAAQEPFFASLRGEPSAQVLHFAMHGKFDPMGLQDGLILVDGNVVDPLMILGADLSQHPFVFLNACQVGQADETLGQYGGMAQSFVEAGASAVIAPLWVVKDEVAREVSLRFYEAAFAGTAPAEFLRSERARDGSGTHLAYVLYGHPLLQLTRSMEADGDGDPAEP
jgi:CHAT domain